MSRLPRSLLGSSLSLVRISSRVSTPSLPSLPLAATRPPCASLKTPRQPFSFPQHSPRHASFSLWSLALSTAVLCALALYHNNDSNTDISQPVLEDYFDPEQSYTMAAAAELTDPGYYLSLTDDQEAKLKELWISLAKITGITKDGGPIGKVASPAKSEEKPVKRGWFGGVKKDDGPAQETDDKFGLAKEYQKALAAHSPEELRVAFWHMAKADHPDSLLLRFLRARKWDVQRALVMCISALQWRISEVHVDDEIMRRGDGGLKEEYEQTKNAATKKTMDDFDKMLRNGQSYVRGRDNEGRPICYIRVRLHKIGAHPGQTIERMTVYHIETSRLLLKDRMETACVIFDMTGFTLANMVSDITPWLYADN